MKTLTALLAMTALVAAPAAAGVRDAAFASSADQRAPQSSVFAGATYRLAFDGRTDRPRGRAALSLAGMKRTASSDLRFSQGLEISRDRRGMPALFLAGQPVGPLRHKANLGGTTTAIIVGGVLVLGVVAAIAVSDYQRSLRCIGEEGDCD